MRIVKSNAATQDNVGVSTTTSSRFHSNLSTLGLAAIGVAAFVIGGCAGSGTQAPATHVAIANGVRVHTKSVVTPPPAGAYLGAQVNPSSVPHADQTGLEAQTVALEAQIFHNISPTRLAVHLQYRSWQKMLQLTNDYGIQQDIAHGRAPLIAWSACDDATLDANGHPLNLVAIKYGYADTDLHNIATQLAIVNNGQTYPIMLRWFWEFNINASRTIKYDNPNDSANDGCFLKQGASTGVPQEPNAPALSQQFTDAWIHIYGALRSQLPHPNVSMVWNPTVAGSADTNDQILLNTPLYYPGGASAGSQYVDWIGADGYDHFKSSTQTAETFDDVFNGFAATYSSYGPPILIGETASCQQYAPPNDQAAYISSILSYLQTSTYQKFKQVNYFDSPGGYTYGPNNQFPCNWNFDSSGLSAFSTIANDPFFANRITP